MVRKRDQHWFSALGDMTCYLRLARADTLAQQGIPAMFAVLDPKRERRALQDQNAVIISRQIRRPARYANCFSLGACCSQ